MKWCSKASPDCSIPMHAVQWMAVTVTSSLICNGSTYYTSWVRAAYVHAQETPSYDTRIKNVVYSTLLVIVELFMLTMRRVILRKATCRAHEY